MRRLDAIPQKAWQQKVEAQGLLFHTNHNGTPYWDESACFVVSDTEIQKLEEVANELHGMFLRACKIAISERRLAELGIPETLHEAIRKSWRYDDWEIYGRLDFTLTPDGTPKLLEYNADTSTGLLEEERAGMLISSFLGRWSGVVPWARLVALIEPHYPSGQRGASAGRH